MRGGSVGQGNHSDKLLGALEAFDVYPCGHSVDFSLAGRLVVDCVGS